MVDSTPSRHRQTSPLSIEKGSSTGDSSLRYQPTYRWRKALRQAEGALSVSRVLHMSNVLRRALVSDQSEAQSRNKTWMLTLCAAECRPRRRIKPFSFERQLSACWEF